LCTVRDLENKQIESTKRIDDLLKQLSEAHDLKNKMTKEYAEFYRRHSSLEFEFQQLTLNYKRASQELDDARMQLETEILVRIQICFLSTKHKKNTIQRFLN
jgi:predicted  nucleic acid-binding Zn-ribbon protein